MSPNKTTESQKKLTRQDILRMIEKNGGPEGLDLRGDYLWGINLGFTAIESELRSWRPSQPGQIPVWYSLETRGINLRGGILARANLQRASLDNADLREAMFGEIILLEEGLTVQGANLQAAVFWKANLEKAILWETDLQEAELLEAQLQEADFSGANLRGANFGGAHLEKVDLSRVKNLSGVFWHNAVFDHTRIKWLGLIPIGEEIAKEYEKAKEAYLLLKDNFNDRGQYDLAREVYIKEREMERKAHWPPWLALTYHPWEFKDIQNQSLRDRFRRLRLYLKYTTRGVVWTWAVLTFFKLTSMYGQRVRYVLASGLFWIILFTFLYPLAGIVRLFSWQDPQAWLRSLTYSIASFATLQLSAGYNVNTLHAQLLTSAEALIGIIWLAYFVYAFTNMMRSS